MPIKAVIADVPRRGGQGGIMSNPRVIEAKAFLAARDFASSTNFNLDLVLLDPSGVLWLICQDLDSGVAPAHSA